METNASRLARLDNQWAQQLVEFLRVQVEAWRRDHLPGLLSREAVVVGSIWGRNVHEFSAAANAMRGAP